MSNPRSKMPGWLVKGYWMEVRRKLQSNHGISPKSSRQAVSTYRALLAEDGIGDIIYHSTVEETAQGIVTGEYVPDETPASPVIEPAHQGNP